MDMNVGTGELNRKISIVTITKTTDASGFISDSEVEYCPCWAKVSNMSGTETFKAGGDFNKVITKFLIRYRSDKTFTTDLKIRYNLNLYDITFINDYNMSHEFIELLGQVIV
ncbi:MAG TPA: phage head closure protein [Clostridium sp.]